MDELFLFLLVFLYIFRYCRGEYQKLWRNKV